MKRNVTHVLHWRVGGILVHEALEAVWKKIKTQENLLAYSESQCQQLSESIVNDIISYRSFPSESTPFLSIEKKRFVKPVQLF